jgi:hypothetical protein
MNLVILEATGGTGRLVVEQALAAGHSVTSDLDWTIVYASPLTDGPATGFVE